jgi:hypothetical protein
MGHESVKHQLRGRWTGIILLLGVCQITYHVLAADTTPPTVVISQPVGGASISGSLTITVAANDNVGIAAVSLMLDGARVLAPLSASPFVFTLSGVQLPPGFHSLLAVAQDTAGNRAKSAVVSITVANPRLYSPASGPFTIENLGSPISANTQEHQIMFRSRSTTDLHLLMYYDVAQYWIYPMQMLDVNLSRNTFRLVDGVIGRPGPYATSLHPNGKIYLGSSDPGFLVEYDPVAGSSRQIAALSQKGAQRTQVGDDGALYIGECCQGGVDRYDPASGLFEGLGRMDDAGGSYQYAYTLGADTRYTYVGMGQQPWYLAVYDRQTKIKTLYWKADGDSSGAVYRGKAGGWYYVRGTASGEKWYALQGGQPSAIAASGLPALFQWYEHDDVVSDLSQFGTSFGVELNLDGAYPDSGANHAVIKWRSLGATSWQSVDVTGFRLQPINIKRLYPWDGTKMFGFADFYGPVFSYDVNTRQTISLGLPQYSLYDALFQYDGVYLSGYTAVTLTYKPSAPWTLTGSALNSSNPSLNPYKVPPSFGKYHYYTAFGADGLVYIGSHHERDSTGGELGWYDPLSGSSGSLRSPFLTYDVRDLKSALGGTKLVYSSDNQNLFVVDVASKQVERTITPIPGIGPLDKVAEVAPGIIFGAVGNRIYAVNIRDGSLLYVKTVPGQAFGGSALLFYDRHLSLGPDGNVWMFIDNSLYRIKPEDGSLQKVIDTPAMNLLFKNADLYLYGGPTLYRINGALISAALAPPTELGIQSSPKP